MGDNKMHEGNPGEQKKSEGKKTWRSITRAFSKVFSKKKLNKEVIETFFFQILEAEYSFMDLAVINNTLSVVIEDLNENRINISLFNNYRNQHSCMIPENFSNYLNSEWNSEERIEVIKKAIKGEWKTFWKIAQKSMQKEMQEPMQKPMQEPMQKERGKKPLKAEKKSIEDFFLETLSYDYDYKELKVKKNILYLVLSCNVNDQIEVPIFEPIDGIYKCLLTKKFSVFL